MFEDFCVNCRSVGHVSADCKKPIGDDPIPVKAVARRRPVLSGNKDEDGFQQVRKKDAAKKGKNAKSGDFTQHGNQFDLICDDSLEKEVVASTSVEETRSVSPEIQHSLSPVAMHLDSFENSPELLKSPVTIAPERPLSPALVSEYPIVTSSPLASAATSTVLSEIVGDSSEVPIGLSQADIETIDPVPLKPAKTLKNANLSIAHQDVEMLHRRMERQGSKPADSLELARRRMASFNNLVVVSNTQFPEQANVSRALWSDLVDEEDEESLPKDGLSDCLRNPRRAKLSTPVCLKVSRK